MAKKGRLVVRDRNEDSVVPYLRGILTRSLTDAGMEFEDAYALADELRSSLGDEEVSTDRLRKVVSDCLAERGLADIGKAYNRPRISSSALYVRDFAGNEMPFSKTELGRSLEICSASRDDLYRVASRVEQEFALKEEVVSTRAVQRATYRVLCSMLGDSIGRQYLQWQEFSDTGRPLILLLGGTTGCGKSTVSALMAHRLGIVRTQSTDMLREVMRQIIPATLLPPLHRSSFMAHRSLPRWGSDEDEGTAPHMLDGYLLQAEEVAIGVEGVFQRALREQVSLILEGVHMHPELQKKLAERGGAVVVPVVIATLGKKALKQQLSGRGRHVSARRAERYMEHFDLIWRLQSFLLSEADVHDVAIVANNDPDESVRKIMEVVSARLAKEYSGSPDVLLGDDSGSA